jgi:hypothetical protein
MPLISNLNKTTESKLVFRSNQANDISFNTVKRLETFGQIPLNFQKSVLNLRIFLDPVLATIHYSEHKDYTIFHLIFEIGGFSIVLYFLLKTINNCNHTLFLELVRDLIKLEPKTKPSKVNTYGVRLSDFDDGRVHREYLKHTQLSNYDQDDKKLNNTVVVEPSKDKIGTPHRYAKSQMSSKSKMSVKISE